MDMKVRELLNRVKEGALTYGKAAGRFATDTAEKARINLQIFDLNTEIDIACKEIGKLVYAMHAGDEVCNEAIQAQIEAIDSRKAQIAQLRARLDAFKPAEGYCSEEPAEEEEEPAESGECCCAGEPAQEEEEPVVSEEVCAKETDEVCCCCGGEPAQEEEEPVVSEEVCAKETDEVCCCCGEPGEKQD